MTTLTMSLRNVLRYKRRSMITAAAIAFGVMCTIAVDGMLVGSERESARNIRDYETGEVKVYPAGYFADRALLPFDKFIEADGRRAVESALGDRRWAPRVNLSAELYFNEDFFAVPGSIHATLTAIDPARDASTIRTAGKVEQGRWLKKGDTGIVIGSWLAEDIGAKVGYAITVECKGRGGFYQTFDAEILGVVTTENPFVNRYGVFMDIDAANDLLALDGGVTEYIVRADTPAETRRTIDAVRAIGSAGGAGKSVDPRSWEEVAYDEILLTKAKSSGSKIYIFFIFIIAAVGISNTMLMAVMERRSEIGMLRALGYGNFGIRCQFLLEGFWIGLIGSAMGLVGGILADLYMIEYGIDFSFMMRDMDLGYRITGIMRSAWNPPGIAAAIVGAVAISTFVAWFPSGKILKKEVADILRS